MPSAIPEELRRLQIDLPACPRALIELQALLGRSDLHAQACADVIAADMALAAEVIKTVNSAMFGLLRRVDHVGEALRYLGTEQVAAITLQAALRRAFTPTPLIDRIWARAAALSWVMGRSARSLGIDPWLAHSAGLFALSGQAIFASRSDLFSRGYAALCESHAGQPADQAEAEAALIGVGHHAVASALCAQWGLSNQVVRYVRARATSPGTWSLQELPVRRLLVLGEATEHLLLDAAAALPGDERIEACAWTPDELEHAIRPHIDAVRASNRSAVD
ncbi:HDOD domain-containing protein [Leptothrix discophora]|uniref:HDOD domain-containing protein n=1 Tax=Leptothrix discophora TaxID=89 RepID=A0ABT9G9H0_LEPDI|nr:HDOD domain-containing protein [Leptothrix discophora]MDP4303002.1 HDOD domain-containing protein [Leptothrix discophora]